MVIEMPARFNAFAQRAAQPAAIVDEFWCFNTSGVLGAIA